MYWYVDMTWLMLPSPVHGFNAARFDDNSTIVLCSSIQYNVDGVHGWLAHVSVQLCCLYVPIASHAHVHVCSHWSPSGRYTGNMSALGRYKAFGSMLSSRIDLASSCSPSHVYVPLRVVPVNVNGQVTNLDKRLVHHWARASSMVQAPSAHLADRCSPCNGKYVNGKHLYIVVVDFYFTSQCQTGNDAQFYGSKFQVHAMTM